MKALQPKKLLGLAIGERSLLAAEVSTGPRPQVRRLGEFPFPEGVSLDQPQALGQALGTFLAERSFTARRAVVGLPARWLLVRSKSVPVVDTATTRQMLRLQAETEFTSELKDLVYDYIPSDAPPEAETRGVLLIAMRRESVEAIDMMCRAARLRISALMPQAAAMVAAAQQQDNWILQAHSQGAGAELAAHTAAGAAIRHLRASVDQPAFTGEFLRAVASLGGTDALKQVTVWNDRAVDASALASRIGMPVRRGELSQLGVEVHLNGAAPAGEDPNHYGRFAPAVALALSGLREGDAINFLQSRLAPPKVRRVPRWAIPAAAAVAALIVGGVLAWNQLQTQETHLQTLQKRLDNMSAQIQSAETFVNKVTFARRWHGDQAQYLQCLRDLTLAIPTDGATYATSLILRDPSVGAASAARPGESRPATALMLNGQLYGKTSNQQAVQNLLDRLKRAAGFTSVKLGGTQNAVRGQEVSFSITFVYRPSTALKSAEPPADESHARRQP